MAVATALAVAAVYAGRKFREIAKYYYGRATFVVGTSRRPWGRFDYRSKVVTPLASWEGVRPL